MATLNSDSDGVDRAAWGGSALSEMVREAWRSNEMQLKVRSILQGGRRASRAEMEHAHELTVRQLVARELGEAARAQAQAQARPPSTTVGMFKTTTTDPDAGRPCSAPIEALDEIQISDLSAGTVHTGGVLWVEVVADFYRVQGATSIVCDRGGGCSTLSLYNFFDDAAASIDCQTRLPKGTVLAIKEPYLKLSNSGDLLIRVDLPSNVVVRTGWGHTRTAVEAMELGNEALEHGGEGARRGVA